MSKHSISLDFEEYSSIEDCSSTHRALLERAYQQVQLAYAPYSKFHVAAAVLLENGEIICGTNQENASYPAGICAERVALSAASSLFPNVRVKTIAIVVQDRSFVSDIAIAPCGICRQTINEYEERMNQNIEILFPGKNGSYLLAESVKSLLPLSFSKSNLEQ